MHKIAIIIKTTPNRKSLIWLLNSIELSLHDVNYRIYIADEEPLDEWKTELYDNLKDQGHFVKIWDKPVAVTIARNHLIDQLQDESFVLRVDDDFELGGEFNIHALLTVLGHNDIDFCSDVERQIGKGKGLRSGDLRVQSANIVLRDNNNPIIKLNKDNRWKYTTHKGINYAKADFMRNLILLKRKCFEFVRWNEDLNFEGEHADFYLSLKKNGLQGAFTPDSIHYHRDDLKYMMIDKNEDSEIRKSLSVNQTVNETFDKKWNGYPDIKYTGVYGIYKKFKNYVRNNIRKYIDI